MIYSLQYKPHEYVVALENINQPVNAEQRKNRIEEIKDMDYFTLRISAQNFSQELLRYKLTDANEYYKRLEYFMSGMQRDIYIKCGQDSLSCTLYHFERTFGIAPYVSVSLGFERTDSEANRVFVFLDKVFGGGKVQIGLNGKIFKKYPELKTE